MEHFTTEVWNMELVLDEAKPDHLGFRLKTAAGGARTIWQKVEPETMRLIRLCTDPHTEHKNLIANMTQAERAEYFKEMGGS